VPVRCSHSALITIDQERIPKCCRQLIPNAPVAAP
jgi:hypothetical protein